MTSKIKNIKNEKSLNKTLFLVMAGILLTLACLGLAVLNSNTAVADDSPKGEIPSSLGFTPHGDSDALVPFTFWQKVDIVDGMDPDQIVYRYHFYALEGGTRTSDGRLEVPLPQENKGEDIEPGEWPCGTDFEFTMTGNETRTFYIDFNKVPLASHWKLEGEYWNFKYQSSMIPPEPKEGYTYDTTTFDVDVRVYSPWTEALQKLKVFCFNPLGDKVYDPGWTITTNVPFPPEEIPPTTVVAQTLDPIWLVVIAGVLIFALCIALAILEKKKRKKMLLNAGHAASSK